MTSNSLKDKVYSQLLHDVVHGEYTVESIISEKKISEAMNVSKAPVREALVQLCAEGVLCSVPRQGYVVTRYTERNIREILDFRAMLECGALEACFDRISPTQLRRLESVVDGEFLFLTNSDATDFWSQTFNFHLTLVSFSENEYVYRCLNSALNTCMRAYMQLYLHRDAMPKPPTLHRGIVDGIRQKDLDRTLKALRKDIYSLFDANDSHEEENQSNGQETV